MATIKTMFKEPVCIQDFEAYAKAYLPKGVFDYFASGAIDQQTLEECKSAFKRLRLRPRVLRDVSCIDMSTTILGQKVDFPVCIAPTAAHKLAHPDGELATARAATRAGTCHVLSSASTTPLKDVARSSSGLKWFQLDIFKRLDVMTSLLQGVESEGYKAIVLTVDNPFFGRKYDHIRNDMSLPPHLSLSNLGSPFKYPSTPGRAGIDQTTIGNMINPSRSWDIIDWLRTKTQLPIVIKGILTAEDAKLAVQHGVDAIIVSSHGGRQLDGVPATIEVLPEIVAAVGDKVEVYVDGGVRFGSDVFKALALGARAVFVGRPILWGLTYQGEEGVYKVLQILKEELRLTMGFCGCSSLKDILKEMVVHESYYRSKL